eukprot:s6_g5.t1
MNPRDGGASDLTAFAQKRVQVVSRGEGNQDDPEVERDSWDEQRLRALCARHGWDFEWMTEDGERRRRANERFTEWKLEDSMASFLHEDTTQMPDSQPLKSEEVEVVAPPVHTFAYPTGPWRQPASMKALQSEPVAVGNDRVSEGCAWKLRRRLTGAHLLVQRCGQGGFLPEKLDGSFGRQGRASSHSKPVEKGSGRGRRPVGTLPSITVRDLNAKGWPSLNPMPLRSNTSMARTMSEPMLLRRGDKPKELPSLGSMKSSEQKLRRRSAWLDGTMKASR